MAKKAAKKQGKTFTPRRAQQAQEPVTKKEDDGNADQANADNSKK